MSRLNAIRSWLTRANRRRADKPAPQRRQARLSVELLEARLPPGDLFNLGLGGAGASSAYQPDAPAQTSRLTLVQPTASQPAPSQAAPPSETTTAEKKNTESSPPPSTTGEDPFPSEGKHQAQLAGLTELDDPNQSKSNGGGASGVQAQFDSSEPGAAAPRLAGSSNEDPFVPPSEPGSGNPVRITNVRDLDGRKGLSLLTHDGKPTIVGKAPAGRVVRIYDNGRPIGLAAVNRFGTFSFKVPTRLADGLHNFRAGLAFGRFPEEIQASIRVDTKAPGVRLSMTDFLREGQTGSGFVNVNDTDALGHIDMVHLDFDLNGDNRYTPNELNSMVFSGSDFSLAGLPEGVYKVRARVHDAAGNVGTSFAQIAVDPNAGKVGSDVLRRLGGMMTETQDEAVAEAENRELALEDVKDTYYTEYNSIAIEARYTARGREGEFRAALDALGFVYTHSTPSSHLVAGYIPIDKIKDLPSIPTFVSATPVPKAITKTGSVNSAGDAQIGGPEFRASQGADGRGVRVGVISDSVNRFGGGLAQSVATGNLPPNVLVLRDGPAGASDEGRAMLEIVADTAPGAPLAFHTGSGGATVFTQGIYALAAAGARVITDDLGYPNSPMFNSGRMGRAIDDVSKRGVSYTTAAGNDDDFAFRAAWNPIQSTVVGISGTFMRFGNDALQTFNLPANASINIKFGWDATYLEGGDPAPRFQVPNNLDVFLIDPTRNVILASSTNVNQQTDEAFEQIAFANGGAPQSLAFAIRLVSGPAPSRLGWITFGSSVTTIDAEGEGATTMFGQVLAARAVTTAAANAVTGSTTVEQFSALGGLIDIFADDQGRRFPVPQLIRKPEVTAPDGVQTSFFAPPGVGTPPQFFFSGTSAATPAVAGAMALLRQQQPRATNLTVNEHLIQTARDLGPRGFDAKAGYGLIQLTPIRSRPNRTSGPLTALEPNNTSLQAVDFRLIGRQTYIQTGLSIRNNHLGLPDFDWFCFTAANAGVLAIKLDNPYLALHLFLPVNGYLEEVPNGTAVRAGQKVFVEVKGRPIGQNAYSQANYELFFRVI
jgi:hypothetical protein